MRMLEPHHMNLLLLRTTVIESMQLNYQNDVQVTYSASLTLYSFTEGLEAIFFYLFRSGVTPSIMKSHNIEMVVILFLLSSLFLAYCMEIDPERVAEEQGYLKREHSLGRPFQGRGTEVVHFTIVSIYIFTSSENVTMMLLVLCLYSGSVLGISRFHCRD